MLEIKKIVSLSEICKLKLQYFSLSRAPLDGMWHFGFVPMSDHFAFYENNRLVGFCCINGEGYMLQFYLSPTAKTKATELFTLIAKENISEFGKVLGAFVSTAETDYLSLCLDNTSSVKVNALMYQHNKVQNIETIEPLGMTLAYQEQLNDFVGFAATNIGAPEQWLSAYFGNLIQRQELWGYWYEGTLLATGECRLFDDYQTDYADLGMIVAESERGKGVATRVLYHLINQASKQGLIPICSTESSNIAAQKAIFRAGFISSNRIIQCEFT
ncbi:GNAT family N-acetyltransferase [Shewanella psychropiezotolerans]|uniref:GNAT family N-acetyltransferase n=1 Tax=Shewanella psychropiezotolerans TaxID=2593655 RepID=A0ABX5X3F9_9GAMM|nr:MULTISPECIES: GNAT family N-acetyltransferase [Shewanella]MPY21379.1 GNAT family N-acetyltransferase [Shewanella sp. YLB-07]MPY22166.1 GNAT family N-acetyltransferase [Shewanella sp. YLB-07]QDO84982.1 GNAT family N-acetyltransferase [Shewanella psychropiezotolerans]